MKYLLIGLALLFALSTDALAQASWTYNIRFSLFDRYGAEVTEGGIELPPQTYVEFDSVLYPVQGIRYDPIAGEFHMWGTAIGNTGLVVVQGSDSMYVSFHALDQVLHARVDFQPSVSLSISENETRERGPFPHDHPTESWWSRTTIIKILHREH